MIKKIKKQAALLLGILTLCFVLPQTVFAADKGFNGTTSGQAPYGILWLNTSSISTNLSFDGSRAICGATVIGNPGTSEITGTVTLARRNTNGTYTTVKTWDNLYTASNILVFNENYYITRGYTYRLTITATVYLNGYGEIASSYYEAYAN